MAGSWKSKKDNGCGYMVATPCMCYTCIVFDYKGCPFSCTNAWTCGDGCVVGTCIEVRWEDKETMTFKWMGMCPEEAVRKAGAPPSEAQQMER